MSIFKSQVRTFTTDITGEELELRINNMVWVVLQDKFGVTQKAYQDETEEEQMIMGAKFITAVLIANGHETTLDEVLEHTDETSVADFNFAYNTVLTEEMNKVLNKHFPKAEEAKTK